MKDPESTHNAPEPTKQQTPDQRKVVDDLFARLGSIQWPMAPDPEPEDVEDEEA